MKSKMQYAFHIVLVVIVAWGLGFSQAKVQAGTPPNGPASLTGNVSGCFS